MAAMVLSVTTAFAQGGTTGPLTWNISGGTLTISGNGAMPDYEYQTPWLEYMFDVRTLIIEYGVTSIGKNAFISAILPHRKAIFTI